MDERIVIMWFRRDLRLDDNNALYHALKSGYKVLPIFIFDKDILSKISNKTDKRVLYIHHRVRRLKQTLRPYGKSILVKYGSPLQVISDVVSNYNVQAIYANHDYEPYAIKRDNAINNFLNSKDVAFHTFKDQVIFEKEEILKKDGKPYTVFTPYSKVWREKFLSSTIETYPSLDYISNFVDADLPTLSLNQFGFEPSHHMFPSITPNREKITNYDKTRNFPALDGTSHLGIYLRFGCISIRKLANEAAALNDTFLNELIWRDFFMMILFHFPQVEMQSFKRAYDQIQWRNNEDEFEKWCNGETGYPFVDAGMRELNATGYMHNRVRMVVASFLTKHLLIDWRWGEAYFAEKLLDYELASNNGNWQWAAGTGCDAAPYFRIFNPTTQMTKFDFDQHYVKMWIKELNTKKYPAPIVDHSKARERALETYKKALMPH